MKQTLYRTEYERIGNKIRKLEYFILESDLPVSYGLAIQADDMEISPGLLYEEAACKDITDNQEEILSIMTWLADNHAHPIHLHDLIEDYLSGCMEIKVFSQIA